MPATAATVNAEVAHLLTTLSAVEAVEGTSPDQAAHRAAVEAAAELDAATVSKSDAKAASTAVRNTLLAWEETIPQSDELSAHHEACAAAANGSAAFLNLGAEYSGGIKPD